MPAYLLAIAVAIFVLNIPGNQLSRRIEASADQFALELTGDPEALVDLQTKLARTNLSDPDPPGCADGPVRHPSADGRPDRRGARVRAGAGRPARRAKRVDR